MADADDSYDWCDLGRFVDKIDEGYDLVMGNRFKGGIEPGAMPPLHRYLGNPALSFISRLVFRAPIGDFHCGMRAFRRDAYARMNLQTSGMEFATEMVASSTHNGLRITEIPIRLYPDKRDRPPHLRSFRDGWRHLRFIVTYAPDYLYLWPGVLMLGIGLLLQALLALGPITFSGAYAGIHFLVLGGLLSILGINVLLMGVLAKLAVQNQHPMYASPFLKFLKRHFRLEWGLLAGGTLTVAGFMVNLLILHRWLSLPHSAMNDTIHPAFVATNAIGIGVVVVFGSFLLHLLLTQSTLEIRRADTSTARAESDVPLDP
jgi:hypothetical protein